MEQYPSQPHFPPGHYPPQKSDLNVWGLVGLITSILGFMTLIVAPLGLIFSLIGLKHEDKGLAIAGTVIGIFSTLWAAFWGSILALYFGLYAALFGACCCMAMFSSGQIQQEMAARDAVAQHLQIARGGVDVVSFSGAAPMQAGPAQASGTAVYADDAGKSVAVDFTCTVEKVDGKWQATEVQITSQTYPWFDVPSTLPAVEVSPDDELPEPDGDHGDGESLKLPDDERASDEAVSAGDFQAGLKPDRSLLG